MAPGVAHELRLIRTGQQGGAGIPNNAVVCGPGERGLIAEEVIFNPRAASLFLENDTAQPGRIGGKAFVPEGGPQAKPDFDHSVTVSRHHGNNLGIVVDQSDGAYLRVQAVNPGLIKDWNRQHPALAIREGDLIVEVNGIVGNAQLMFSECKRRTLLHMKVRRESTGPCEVYELGQSEAVMLVNRAMSMLLAKEHDNEVDEASRYSCGGQFLDESHRAAALAAVQATPHVPQAMSTPGGLRPNSDHIGHHMPPGSSGKIMAPKVQEEDASQIVSSKPDVPMGDHDAINPLKEDVLPVGVMQHVSMEMLPQSNPTDDLLYDEQSDDEDPVPRFVADLDEICHSGEKPSQLAGGASPPQAEAVQSAEGNSLASDKTEKTSSTAVTAETAAIEKRLLAWMDVDELAKVDDERGIVDWRFGQKSYPQSDKLSNGVRAVANSNGHSSVTYESTGSAQASSTSVPVRTGSGGKGARCGLLGGELPGPSFFAVHACVPCSPSNSNEGTYEIASEHI